MDPARYLVGSPVYRGASNAPTRGPVDPMGYINRSIASPVGRDGLSDRRSGLASAALARLSMGAGSPQHAPMHMQPVAPPPAPDHGFTVSAIGQLIPTTPTPLQTTAQAIHGGPQGPSPEQLMEAARNRLQHQIQVKEMLTKHQINMHQMAMNKADMINRHRQQVTRG